MKLHLGCGAVLLKGWINIDIKVKPSADDPICWRRNLCYGLPMIGNGKVSFIHSEHFLEHLTPDESRLLLHDCRRVLKPGGVIRTGMPSLAYSVQRYLDGTWREMWWAKKDGIQTAAEYLNCCFRWWGHRWLYDEEELVRRLKEAGFTETRSAVYRESTVPELRDLESQQTTTVIVEAVK